MAPSILRLPLVLRIRGRSKSMHYEDISQGLFPHPIKIGARAVGWVETEVFAMNAARVAGLCDTEIRQLVLRLEAERKQVS